jgi:hypothetical protein
MDNEAYNPLDKRRLAASVGEALLEREVVRIDQLVRFAGSGVYVIYYVGAHPSYAPLAFRNRDGKFEWPVYAGKAVPPGSRQGGGSLAHANDGGAAMTETPVYARLRQHAASLSQAGNLEVADFYCRYLIVDPLWIPLGESIIITSFAPIWNTLLDGFGNHNPGRGRQAGMVSRWDVMHPGRKWAHRFQPRPESRESLEAEVGNTLGNATVPRRPRLLLDTRKAAEAVRDVDE